MFIRTQGKVHLRGTFYKKQKGFAIFTLVTLLTMACLTFSLKMVSIVRWENQRLGDNFRSLEAFINAESGMNLLLSQLVSVSGTQRITTYLDKSCHFANIKNCLPYIENNEPPFTLILSWRHDKTIEFISMGASKDGQAHKKIHINVKFSNDISDCSSGFENRGKVVNLDNYIGGCYRIVPLTWRDF
ncbi:hypothetical protein [Psychromonas sp. CD1]|uniref:hypothetical protein n=1 Tax=Psychromonas sp. CD1 TaxID=1979839 RepID=UPI000B9B165F|nr:hypothetical protein [Psychromonas sp. CD1]